MSDWYELGPDTLPALRRGVIALLDWMIYLRPDSTWVARSAQR